MNFMYIFDAIILALGVYLLYSALLMKTRSKIPTAFVPDSAGNCKDKEAFLHLLFPRTLLFAIVTLAFGVEALIGDLGLLSFLGKSGQQITNAVMIILFLLVWIYFSKKLKDGLNQYYSML